MIQTIASWHPFIVHFAVAFVIGSALFDILDFFLNRRRFEETGFMLMIVALPFLLLAVISGNLAEPFARVDVKPVHLENHIAYANITVWVFTAAALWRIFIHFKRRYVGKQKVIYIFIVTLAAVSAYLAALHGGRIRHSPERFEIHGTDTNKKTVDQILYSQHL